MIGQKELLALALATSMLVSGCTSKTHNGSEARAAATAAPGAPTSAALQTLREQLPELAKAHSDRVQLTWLVMFKNVDPDVKAFSNRMASDNKRLQNELKTWADKHGMDLKFRFTDDAVGRARQVQEKTDGDLLQHDSNADFQRDMLIFMYTDYDWQLHLLGALKPMAPDAELARYFNNSARVHEEHLAMLRNLLKRYRMDKSE